MAFWLVKSEPETWSWDQQMAKGAKGTDWDGVRNFTAAGHLKAMKAGDKAFFYHSGGERRIERGAVRKTGCRYPAFEGVELRLSASWKS